jgi:carbonic anhydrase/acetyltransferase-like protein (isoleucine patch superfamily)
VYKSLVISGFYGKTAGSPPRNCEKTAFEEARMTKSGFVRCERRICSMIRTYKGVTPVVPASCYIDPSAQVIGDVILGDQASVWMNAVIRGDVNSIRIGAKSNVQDCVVLHGMRHLYPVIVGEMVTIGHNATVHGCVLEDAVLVGIGATILNNARIGEGSIIAAGAVIPEQTVIPPNSLVAGVPGKVRRTLGDADRTMILKYAQNYLDYTAIYLKELSSNKDRI